MPKIKDKKGSKLYFIIVNTGKAIIRIVYIHPLQSTCDNWSVKYNAISILFHSLELLTSGL